MARNKNNAETTRDRAFTTEKPNDWHNLGLDGPCNDGRCSPLHETPAQAELNACYAEFCSLKQTRLQRERFGRLCAKDKDMAEGFRITRAIPALET